MLKILMIGWELPPYSVGGLGIHCSGLIKPLSTLVDLTFVVPFKFKKKKPRFVKIIDFDVIKPRLYLKTKRCVGIYTTYQRNDYKNYAKEVKNIKDDFDLIHTQDWMTSIAGVALKKISGKKLVITCHSVAYDTSKDPKKTRRFRYLTERVIFKKADKIIAVSKYTKNQIVKHYNINPLKIKVIYNAIINKGKKLEKKKEKRTVLYLGRLSYQKGISYFIEAAEKVIKKDPTVKFLIVGAGSKKRKLIKKVKELGIEKNVKFLGYVKDKDRTYRNAGIFVMPSISEPFGFTPLEAMRNGTPALISRQSGVSEILKNCIKFNYWDTNDLVRKILRVLNNKKLYNSLRKKGFKEVNEFSWEHIAKETADFYKKIA